MSETRIITECICQDTGHIMVFSLFSAWQDTPPELYVEVQLNPLHPWWRRGWLALRYIMGKGSRFNCSHWDSGSLNRESAMKLLPVLGEFIALSASSASETRTGYSGEKEEKP